jgi:ferredoxin-type protein NapG
MSEQISRQQLFRLNPFKILEMISNKSEHKTKNNQTIKLNIIRPPGAIEESQFINTCEQCHACIDACEYNAIQPLGPETGSLENTPALFPGSNACHWCDGFPCNKVCPSGALQKTDSPNAIAKVQLNHDNCFNAQGILCDDCVSVCPPSVGAISSSMRDIALNTDMCVGCGMCIDICESPKPALTIKK